MTHQPDGRPEQSVTSEAADASAIRFPPGAQILVRDEEWLVKSVSPSRDGAKIEAVGVSEFVRDEPAVFFTEIERLAGDGVRLLDPEDTELVEDPTDHFRRSRLFLEALLRKTPLPQTERGLALADRFLVDPLSYQQRPAELALSLANLRPRLLIADVVGLGKTLEIGLTLAELIRRGRGERILVVTPQHVLEQFQHELWTRFSIPLIRLDSVGIQRIQREIPAGRNPFTHYKRVIVSVDTLKNIGQYRHHLEKIQWDAVVIDESHNLINRGSQRNALARVLAPNTDALLLASATPHNGDGRSFAELISLLDPAAIANPSDYDAEKDLGHLFIRRTKVHPEVRDQIGKEWADRDPTVSVPCTATEAEERIFAELTRHWLPGPDASTEFGTAPSGRTAPTEDRLFPYTLLKAFLSSHRALAKTVTTRISTLNDKAAKTAPGTPAATRVATELTALKRLEALASAIGETGTRGDSSKLDALVEQLTDMGVRPGSATRVVVFSERVETLKWLAKVVPDRLGFTDDQAKQAVRVMHGGLSDKEQMEVVEAFGLAHHPVRILFTGDVASEGVNLHRQCHDLVHYDIPWSLIRIEQRNGRIDRYGQKHNPRFRALILHSATPGAKDDRTVAEKLLKREEEAYRLDGTAEAVTGLYRAEEEERRLIRDLLAGRTVEESLADSPTPGDPLTALFSQPAVLPEHRPVPRAQVPSLFGGDTEAFVRAALDEVYDERPHDALDLSEHHQKLPHGEPSPYLSLATAKAPDLLHRLDILPPDYLREQKLKDRLRVTFDRRLGQHSLDEARGKSGSSWPAVGYLTDIHPLVEWLVDKVLVQLGRQQAPVILTPGATGPAFLVQGIYSNKLGRPTVVEWMAVRGLPGTAEVVPMPDALAEAGVGPDMANPAAPRALPALQQLVPAAVAAAHEYLEERKDAWTRQISAQLDDYRARLGRWQQEALLPGRVVEDTIRDQTELADKLTATGRPLLRVLAVLDRA
ncbi:SNF2-related protein [Streptomyces sp. NPDC003730]